MRTFLLLLMFWTIAAPSEAQPVRERFLLPVYFENVVPGAFGSMWKSGFAVHNDSGGTFFIDWCSPDPGCIAILDDDAELLPNETQLALPGRYPKPTNGAAGAVMYVHADPSKPPGDLNALSFELRVTDMSRSATNAGTEIPVVRESAFRTTTVQLLDVPTDARFRPAFRIFEMNLDQADFMVRVFDQNTNAIISEQRVTTMTPEPQGTLRFHPGFAQLTTLIPSGTIAPLYVRIEVEPLTSGSAFWAYISITNNDSQQLTLITPQ